MTDTFRSRDERWLLPEGIEELLPDQAERLERLRRDLLDLFSSWGYRLVITPIIEHLDSLLVGTGSDLELQTFKLTDQVTGRSLGVRADMTPQVARIDAHRLKSAAPTRLCYVGPVLHTRPEGFARTRSPYQVGAELYGHGGIESDVEILQLMVETLGVAGLRGLHLDFGHVGVFRGLALEAGLKEDQEQELFEALQRKARSEITELLCVFDIDTAYQDMLLALIELNGGGEVLNQAREAFRDAGHTVHAALDNLENIATLVDKRIPSIAPCFDLAELRGYYYQTGVVFAAFVPGYGQEIARGGRYDDIGKVFGTARPATGFSTDLETLILLGPQRAHEVRAILAPNEDDATLNETVAKLRRQGERVCYALPGHSGSAQDMGCDRVLERRDGRWIINKLG